jgi:amino-acid N-acetyltransferase
MDATVHQFEMSAGEAVYTLRPANEADFPTIRRLIYAVQINPLGLAWPNFVVAVDAHARIIGCGQVKNHGDGSYELASIAVVPEWRSHGVAAAIIRRLLDEHPSQLFLTCRSGLGSFYRRFGFHEAQDSELFPYFQRLIRTVKWLRRLRLAFREGLLVMVNQ